MQPSSVNRGLFPKARILTAAVAIAIAAGAAQQTASAGNREPGSLFRLPAASAERPLAGAVNRGAKAPALASSAARPDAARAGVAARAARLLPAPTGPGAPFRQTMTGDCSFNSPLPAWSGITFCKFAPVFVPANRLLEIENVSCLIKPVLGALLLSKSGDVATLFDHVVGSVINATSSPQGGPFYFGPGERIYIWGVGDPGSPAYCAVHGLLSPTS